MPPHGDSCGQSNDPKKNNRMPPLWPPTLWLPGSEEFFELASIEPNSVTLRTSI